MVIFLLQRVRLEQASDGSTLVLGPAEPGDEAVRQNDEMLIMMVMVIIITMIMMMMMMVKQSVLGSVICIKIGFGKPFLCLDWEERERELAQYKSNNAKR